ncbi:PAS domain-containing sensor histidine kinase [Spirosoma spitsbergense]|uniref:PAS domain-containing sensor histidine kinase n=1 Tax=Spirosoma spitsbergense TaxID=431554 RepID=UPI0003776F6E|nr:PAS domain-containing protein [Spirosoma spitsbergense]
MSQPFATESTSQPTQEAALFQPSFDHLHAALRSGLTATWFWDITNDSLYGDPTLFNMLGIEQDKINLPTHVFTDVIHPDDRQRVINLIDEAKKKRSCFEADYRLMTARSESKWVFSRGQFTYNQQHEPVTFSGILINVSDRKEIELKARMADEELRLAIESAQLGTWDYNLFTDELIWSDRTRELFGLPASTPVNYPLFLQCLHPDDRDATNQAIQAIMQSGGTGHFHHEYRTVSVVDRENVRWLRSSGRVFFTEKQEPYRFIGMVIDITADKQNEETLQQRVDKQTRALEQQAHQLRTTLDASLNSIIAITAVRNEQNTIVDFRMDTANKAVIHSLSRTPEELVGQSLLTVFPGNKDNGFFDLYVRVVNSEQSEQTTQYYRDELGLEGWFEVSAVKQDGESVVVTFNNITHLKQSEQTAQQQATELNTANIELKRSNESLQQFAHIASHDLQEPLRRIQSFSDLLQSQFADSLSDGEKDMVRRIQKSAGRMQSLVKDLLFYSQLSSQLDSFKLILLTDIIEDVLSDLEITIAEKKATIKVASLPEVRGNVSRLRQLFQNLIANALKFSATGIAPFIQIDFREASPDELPEMLQSATRQDFWLITVKDNGIGFDVRYKDRVFTPFQRLHSPVTYSGTGIGLAICQRVAQNHGGAVDVDSEIGSGSTFKIFLPVPDAISA